jgi:hypothetical protein
MFKSFLGGLAALVIVASAASAQERQWFLDATEEDAFLVFGVPETDDTGLSIWCTIQSRKAKIFLPEASEKLKPDAPGTMELIAGDVAVKLNGTSLENQESGVSSLEVEVETSNPIFAAMMKTDRLKIHVEGAEQIIPLADADIEGLLKLCNGAP